VGVVLLVIPFTFGGMAHAAQDDPLLDDMQRRCVRYFLEQADPHTGLVADRAPADAGELPHVASIAATGFGLTAICIADQRGWIEPDAAYGRVLTTLRFLWEEMEHVHGYFYHFVDRRTGERPGTASFPRSTPRCSWPGC
jgi:hypothetical protein